MRRESLLILEDRGYQGTMFTITVLAVSEPMGLSVIHTGIAEKEGLILK